MTSQKSKKLYLQIENQVLAGEDKTAIYQQYATTPLAKRVARILAQIPTVKRRVQCQRINQLLMIVVALLALVKAVSVMLYLRQHAVAHGALLILIAPMINILLIWTISKYRGVGYLLILLLSISGLSRVFQTFGVGLSGVSWLLNMINLLGVISSVVLAIVLLRFLLPQTSFFLSPKKDASGRPLFEE